MSHALTAVGLNGVSFYTKSGVLKSKYFRWEKLDLSWAVEEDLAALYDLWCSGAIAHIVAKDNPSLWNTSWHKPSRDSVLFHLLGNVLPGRPVLWVGARSKGRESFIAIDVDKHPGEERDFRRRCKYVRRALRALGVPDEGVLVVRTPSGGIHYYFFLSHRIDVHEIPAVLAMVGIVHRPGRFEIFPSTERGLRLPFGYLPGKEHDPTRWVQWIRRYRTGQIPKLRWNECRRRAKNYAAKHPEIGTELHRLLFPNERPCVDTSSRGKHRDGGTSGARTPHVMPLERHDRKSNAAPNDIASSPKQASEQIRANVERLWHAGISAPGSRTEETLALAWNCRFVTQLTGEETAAMLIEWVYRTGHNKSATVKADIARSTRKAEEHTRQIVAWIYELPSEPRIQKKARS